jgi:hypothetical protein
MDLRLRLLPFSSLSWVVPPEETACNRLDPPISGSPLQHARRLHVLPTAPNARRLLEEARTRSVVNGRAADLDDKPSHSQCPSTDRT